MKDYTREYVHGFYNLWYTVLLTHTELQTHILAVCKYYMRMMLYLAALIGLLFWKQICKAIKIIFVNYPWLTQICTCVAE